MPRTDAHTAFTMLAFGTGPLFKPSSPYALKVHPFGTTSADEDAVLLRNIITANITPAHDLVFLSDVRVDATRLFTSSMRSRAWLALPCCLDGE